MVKGTLPPCLGGGKGRCLVGGNGGLEDIDLRRIVRPWPHLSQGHSLSPCPDSGAQPGGLPSAPAGPLGPPGHGQTLGKSEGIRAG